MAYSVKQEGSQSDHCKFHGASALVCKLLLRSVERKEEEERKKMKRKKWGGGGGAKTGGGGASSRIQSLIIISSTALQCWSLGCCWSR